MNRYFILSLLSVFVASGCAHSHKGKFVLLENIKKNQKKIDVEKLEEPEVEVKSTLEESKQWIPAQTNKIWVNSHVDDQGNLVEGHYQHIIIRKGHWSVSDGRTNTRSTDNNSIQ